MSRDDSEFAAYLAARWPSIVRALELLGHPPGRARALALEGLSRVWPDWSRIHREQDVETAVWTELLEARDRDVRRHGDPPAPEPLVEAPPGLPEQADRLVELVAALAAMSAGERLEAVLVHVAGLDDDQLAAVLAVRAPGPVPVLPDADVRLALEAIPVAPVSAAEIAAVARARRRTAWRRGAAVVAVLALVAGAAVWLLREDDGLGEVTRAENPLPMAWYADGRLHLDEVAVTVRPVVDLVTVPGGVVLADVDGAVEMIDEEGSASRIGTTVPGEGLVVEPDNGWVAWADPGDGAPQVVVHDTRVGDVVGRRSLEVAGAEPGQPVGDSGPIAIDGEQVYYRTRDTDFVWEPLSGTAFSVDGQLADVAQSARMSEVPGGYLVQPTTFRSGTRVTGAQGRLTPDGRYAFVVEGEELLVHDVAEGRRVERMYSPSDRAVAWTYLEGAFYVAVLHKLQDKTYQDMLQMPSEGNYRIFECVPGRADACIEQAEVPEDAPEAPVLAR